VSLPDRSAVIHFSQNETLALSHEGFLMIPPGVGIVAVKPAYRQKPLYWQLPSMLLGDMVNVTFISNISYIIFSCLLLVLVMK